MTRYAHKTGSMHEIYHKSLIYAHIWLYVWDKLIHENFFGSMYEISSYMKTFFGSMYEISSYMKTFFGSMYEISSYMKTFFGSMYGISSYMKTFFGSMYEISSCYDRGFLIDEIMLYLIMYELFHDPYYYDAINSWTATLESHYDISAWQKIDHRYSTSSCGDRELGAFCTCDMSSTYFIVDLTSCWDRLHHSCAVRFLLWKNCLTSHLVGSPMLTLGWLVPLVIRIDSVSISCCLPCHLNSAYF